MDHANNHANTGASGVQWIAVGTWITRIITRIPAPRMLGSPPEGIALEMRG